MSMTFSAFPISSVTIQHLEQVCAEAVPESESIEFKENLSSMGDDRWATELVLTERARNGILREAVAFANAHGGRVVIGIAESDDRPARAERISPIARCHDLAERIAHAARDVISPQIPLLTVRGVSTDGAANGCVIIDIHESPLAPHRLEANAQCFVRRADRTEKMTMREIQDLTIDRLRGSERSQVRLDQLAATLPKGSGRYYYLQIAATPTSTKIALPWNIELSRITPKTSRFESRLDNIELELPCHGFVYPKTILRGWRWLDNDATPQLTFDVYWDGSIVVQFRVNGNDADWVLFPEWVIGFAGNTLLEIDQIRNVAGAPDAEYALMFQIQSPQTFDLMRYGEERRSAGGVAGNIGMSVYPPMYAVTLRETFSDLVEDVQRDVFNAAGVTVQNIDVKV